jgi:hypothetical protein
MPLPEPPPGQISDRIEGSEIAECDRYITKRARSFVIRKLRISSNASRSISLITASFDFWLDASSNRSSLARTAERYC